MKSNQKYNGKIINSLITLTASEGKLPTDIKVLPLGMWNTSSYGPMEVDSDCVKQMVANFNLRKAVPVDVDHDGGAAAGWITQLIDKGSDGLHAVVEWTKLGEQLLTDKIYKLFSPEWSFNYVDPEMGTMHGPVLIAGSLTNRPLFKELPFLVASDKTNAGLTNDKNIVLIMKESTMNTKDILAKPVADRTPEEVAFLSAPDTELTDEQKTQLTAEADAAKAEADAQAAKDAEAQAQADKAKAEAEAEAVKVEGEKEAEVAADAGDVAACEKGLIKAGKSEAEAHTAAEKMVADKKAAKESVTITASELARLQAAEKELVKSNVAKEVTEKYITAADGVRILPAHKDAVVDFILKCNDEQKEAFHKILASIQPVKIDSVIGDPAHTEGLTAKESIDKLVKEAREADKKLSSTQALKQVLAKNPELANKYDENK